MGDCSSPSGEQFYCREKVSATSAQTVTPSCGEIASPMRNVYGKHRNDYLLIRSKEKQVFYSSRRSSSPRNPRPRKCPDRCRYRSRRIDAPIRVHHPDLHRSPLPLPVRRSSAASPEFGSVFWPPALWTLRSIPAFLDDRMIRSGTCPAT